MTSTLISYAEKGLISFVGGNILSSIPVITSTTQSIFNMLANINLMNVFEVSKSLRSMDIEVTSNIINELIKEIPKDKLNSKTLTLCLDSIGDILGKIERELFEIHRQIKYNQSLWLLSSVRSYSCYDNIQKLEGHKKILDSRLRLLFDIVQIRYELAYVAINLKKEA